MSGTCLHCKAKLEAGDAWCAECGNAVEQSASQPPMPVSCGACGEIAEAGDQWCASCGTPLGPSQNNVELLSASIITPMQTVSPRVSLTPIGGYTPPQSAAHAPSSTQPSAFIDVENANGRKPHTSQAEQAHSVGQEDPPFAEAGVSGRAAATTEALNATRADALYAASETRAGKSVKNHWLGWAVLAFVVLVGIFSISAAKRSGERKIEAMRAVAAVPATPRPPTEDELKQAAIDARWREAADYNARLEARQRAEAEAQRRSAEAFERALSRVNNEMNSMPETQPDTSAMQRQQDQQMRDMQTRADQMKSQQEQQIQELKQQQEKAQREAEDNKLIVWTCSFCGREIMRPAGPLPGGDQSGTCIDQRTGQKRIAHFYVPHK